MATLTGGPATMKFEQEYKRFEEARKQAQQVFLESRLEMLEQTRQASGSDLRLDEWLIRQGGPVGGAYHFWEDSRPRRTLGDGGLWNILFTDVYGHGNGRERFVKAFNEYLKSKEMRARLRDVGLQMYFIDVAHY